MIRHLVVLFALMFIFLGITIYEQDVEKSRWRNEREHTKKARRSAYKKNAQFKTGTKAPKPTHCMICGKELEFDEWNSEEEYHDCDGDGR